MHDYAQNGVFVVVVVFGSPAGVRAEFLKGFCPDLLVVLVIPVSAIVWMKTEFLNRSILAAGTMKHLELLVADLSAILLRQHCYQQDSSKISQKKKIGTDLKY